jgi:hypothetical protein
LADKVRDHGRHGHVEADHVQHAAVVRVGQRDAVAGMTVHVTGTVRFIPAGAPLAVTSETDTLQSFD